MADDSKDNSRVLRCTCSHTYQDEKYGKNKRVHGRTESYPDKEYGGWRCTICCKEKSYTTKD